MTPTPLSREAAALPASPRGPLRQAIDAACRAPEAECLEPLILAARLTEAQAGQVRALARSLVAGVRAARVHRSGVDALMREFSLSTHEGVALMCLAEALLRVPDADTADRLIRDKLAAGDWQAHIGHSPSMFVNAAAWGLLITGRLVGGTETRGLRAALGRLAHRGGEPLVRKGMDLAMRVLGEQFVIGQDIPSALETARFGEARGYRYAFDLFGEAAVTAADAERYFARYAEAIHAIGQGNARRGVIDGNGMAIKLSALHPRYRWSQRDRVMGELLPRVRELFLLAREYDIGVSLDAEEADRLELSLDVFEALAMDPAFDGWHGLGFVVQAYQKRAPRVIDALIALARRSGHRLMLRLVKGAYWDTEIKRAQVDGLADYPVFTRKVHTDVAYLACARTLLDACDLVYPQFATHNAHTLAAVCHLIGGDYHPGDYEFQCLHGMGETLYDQVVTPDGLGRQVRIYAPVGAHETLLAYLVRRLLENGANSSFVNRIVDEEVPVDALVADPVVAAAVTAGAPHPAIPLPVDVVGPGRRAARGLDLASEPVRQSIVEAIAASREVRPEAVPMIAAATGDRAAPAPVCNPADPADVVGTVCAADAADAALALEMAAQAAEGWARTPVADRALLLERAADAMERECLGLMALAIREAGKSWRNALAEVREAVDFCRYYAQQARQMPWGEATVPLGPVVCLSPWNFPLAIFVGQVAAALVAGNPVVAKPAARTPLMATRAVGLFHAVGVPAAVLQCLPGAGAGVGEALVADARTRGVMFTGSTHTARHIARVLAQRGDIPLIAQTGGQNALIVDSSALPEQVVADVLTSAFDSAGQRCSALRVLCLQEEVADRLLAMIRAAMRELRVGDPADVRTDIGPVIDATALDRLRDHVAAMTAAGMACDSVALTPDTPGHFMPPTLIELDRLARLEDEVFGPVLHVLRYRADALPQLIETINATGYGLTLGIHSRVDERIDAVVTQARAGNIYVNRDMIGAVVGVQPFGGEGRSGTGPKAGGPLYLQRLVRQPAPPAIPRLSPALHPQLDAFEAWLVADSAGLLSEGEINALIGLVAGYGEASLANRSCLLPGPTGEENRLHFRPRGRAGALTTDLRALLHQLAAALATDNRILIADEPVLRTRLDALPAAVAACIDWVPDVLAAAPDVVLFDGARADAEALRQRLAAGTGALIGLLTPSPRYDLTRLIVERSVSVNTAAAGGNAGLMALPA
ncbi:bifunctional proline dehydrogenase/L-glutamate gamma-semialdehyde dehydrogenase PutA [Nitrogeniibacter mangrovi]|uniref:Bifunctional protein PutA n=1 Tax=Nitrogeniibacter mangrovi TaxID=2016596 RepID=A0A6C1B506_9RHOO|nr:bifunctional proline dehydrogenase/L-glutamate gamma-semialdehyde dehydrogenase PutA [Nitrogeniibacter mangrovi]QID18557.1 bifunctional proline dehydrogenase/L-glutamate gamma-semialdehyde dehydrogenase PutA [Nitrogeniibacter mangrovi]